MVLFILTRAGFDDIQPLIQSGASLSVWINASVLSIEEVDALRDKGLDLTTISYPINPCDIDGVMSELETIQLHHPGHRIWVETRITDAN